MRGKRYREKRTDQVCQNCGLVFSARGIKPHEDNCEREDWILDPDRDARSPELKERMGGDRDPPSHGEEEDPSDGIPAPTGSGGTDPTTATTDGGRSAPPTPDLDDDRDDDGDGPQLGERFIEVEEYLDEIRDEVPDEHVAMLRDELSEYDVVDVEETTATSIEALPIEEVPT